MSRLRFCRCGAVVDGKCDKCKRQNQAGNTKANGYDWDWQQLSVRLRKIRPLCEDCLDNGRVTAAVECHHIISIKDEPERRLDPDNVVCVCRGCHLGRHSNERSGA